MARGRVGCAGGCTLTCGSSDRGRNESQPWPWPEPPALLSCPRPRKQEQHCCAQPQEALFQHFALKSQESAGRVLDSLGSQGVLSCWCCSSFGVNRAKPRTTLSSPPVRSPVLCWGRSGQGTHKADRGRQLPRSQGERVLRAQGRARGSQHPRAASSSRLGWAHTGCTRSRAACARKGAWRCTPA